jgi:hypothetical protein
VSAPQRRAHLFQPETSFAEFQTLTINLELAVDTIYRYRRRPFQLV